jgi:hypothetical protein
MHELGEMLKKHGHFLGDALFRDDGERIIAYPNRRRLLLSFALQAFLLAVSGIGGAFAFISIDNVPILFLLVLCIGILVPFLILTLYRLLIRRPTLVVGPDGILDNGSLIATGMGLLRWDEILGVTERAVSSRKVANHYFDIVVADAPAIRRRQPLWKRVALRFIMVSSPSAFNISQGMLDIPTNELEAQIRRYVETHAPRRWLPKEDDEDSLPAEREDG